MMQLSAARLALRQAAPIALALLLSACATVPTPQSSAQSERANELTESVRSGRFVIRATTHPEGQPRGAQGRFEWLSFRARLNAEQSRQVLIWVGPLGQTLGRIEQQREQRTEQQTEQFEQAEQTARAQLAKAQNEQRVINAPPVLLVFSTDPDPLTAEQQSSFMASLLGTPVTPREVEGLITKLMALFTQAARRDLPRQELRLQHEGLMVDLRLVFDPT